MFSKNKKCKTHAKMQMKLGKNATGVQIGEKCKTNTKGIGEKMGNTCNGPKNKERKKGEKGKTEEKQKGKKGSEQGATLKIRKNGIKIRKNWD